MRTRQGETICLGEWIRPASADFPPAGGVWGGMRAGFGLGVFGKSFWRFKLNNILIFVIIILQVKTSNSIMLSIYGK